MQICNARTCVQSTQRQGRTRALQTAPGASQWDLGLLIKPHVDVCAGGRIAQHGPHRIGRRYFSTLSRAHRVSCSAR